MVYALKTQRIWI